MLKGLKIEEIVVGEGRAAQKGDYVSVKAGFYLNHGDRVPETTDMLHQVQIGRRRTIAGFEQGIIGMQVGGKRKVRIPPHLAYKENGLCGRIPPNAVLVCVLELIEIQDKSGNH